MLSNIDAPAFALINLKDLRPLRTPSKADLSVRIVRAGEQLDLMNLVDYNQVLRDIIAKYNVVVFGRDGCPYCVKAKNLLTEKQIPFLYADISKAEYRDLVTPMINFTGMKTIPQVFVGGKLLGGYTDLAKAIQNGTLKTQLAYNMLI